MVGDDNVPATWLQPLQSVELQAPPVAEPAGDDLHFQPAEVTNNEEDCQLQDPQLVRVASLQAQRDLHNSFDQRLHGMNCVYFV